MSFTDLNYHIVYSTKERRPFIDNELRPRLIKYTGGVVRELNGSLVEANGPCDHLHLAVSIPPTIAVADFVGTLKANSSKWIHSEFAGRQDFAWQAGYSAFSVSHSVIPRVVEYARSQIEHHRKSTFEEELVALLDKHGITYDARYVFG